MKRSILAIIATIALSIPAVASAATFAESFERDMDRNHTQVSSEARIGQDSVQQYVNRSINGSDLLIASFDRDLYHSPAQGSHTAGLVTDAFQQQFNLALRAEYNPVLISFNRDLNRTATPAVSATRSVDTIQQWVNVALTENSNPLIASFDRVMGIQIATATDYQEILLDVNSYGTDWNAFRWNSEMITAHA